MTFEKVNEFLDFVEGLGFGEIAHVNINFSQDEAALDDLAESSKLPLSRFAQYLRENQGLAYFDTLKIQEGMPVFGTVPFQRGQWRAIQSRKFN